MSSIESEKVVDMKVNPKINHANVLNNGSLPKAGDRLKTIVQSGEDCYFTCRGQTTVCVADKRLLIFSNKA